jgi:biotin carboxyl carrier protein
MRLHLLVSLLKWVLALGLFGGLLFGVYLVHERMRAERTGEAGKAESRPRAKEGKVELEEDEAERYGLETEPARAVQWYERLTVYGRVVPNPRATAEVRSPFAGTLRAASDSPWPAPGKCVRSGQVLGWVDVRLGPEVRLDLENKLAEARIKQRGAEEEVQLQQSRVASLRAVTTQEIIARAELDAALVQLAQARTQLATAKAAAGLWQKALEDIQGRNGGKDSPWSQPLAAPTDGEVTELLGRPGMAVEAGSLVVQLVDFRRPLVRLDIPPEVVAGGPPPQVVLLATPATPPGLRGVLSPPQSAAQRGDVPHGMGALVGPAPQLDVASQFVGYWYEMEKFSGPGANHQDAVWRAGLQVKAYLKSAAAESQPAVSVPAAAVLYHEGRALVYVHLKRDKYQRREVRLLGREGDRWVLARREGQAPTGVAPGEAVVSRQAQVLLSEEFKQMGGDADND